MRASAPTLRKIADPSALSDTRSGRLLQEIRRDMDIKRHVFDGRLRNEEVLSLSYREGEPGIGGSHGHWKKDREHALNLPFRHMRWIQAQATSKKMIVKVNRDAGAGQRPSGPSDDETGMWVGITLGRVCYEAGFRREMNAVVAEVEARGTSVMGIGYHEQAISLSTALEVGKDAQSVIADVLGAGDTEAKPGQAHAEIAAGMGAMAEDEMFQMQAGQEGVQAVLDRKMSHDQAAYKDATYDGPKSSTRLIRRKVWMRKLRVGEDVGWAPWVYDVEDSPYVWERLVWTVAEVKRSDLFTAKFKREVKGYDGRNVSGVFTGGQTPSTDSMTSEGRQSQSDGVLDDDERMVEFFRAWYRCPDMISGGYVKIVAPEMPDEFVEADDSNPYVDEAGYALIPGFHPFYDFTPILSTLTVSERTCGIPPISVGMTQFENTAEYNRLRRASALRHSIRVYQIDPGIKNHAEILAALQEGRDGYGFVAPSALVDPNTGKMREGVLMLQFTGNTQEIDRQAAREESDWVKVMGMPPAVLQGMGTAETATQDSQGIAAGERESGALVEYFEERMAAVLAGIRGLVRGNYDDEDFIALLGQEGAAVMKAWQTGTVDDGDEIEVTFGARALAQETVDKKQLMEAITLLKGEIEQLTGQPIYDSHPLFEELFRRLGVGAPKMSPGPIQQLQQMVMALAGQIEQLTGVNPLNPQPTEGAPQSNGRAPTSGGGSRGAPPRGKPAGPNPAEGDGPTQGNLSAGALRGTLQPTTQ